MTGRLYGLSRREAEARAADVLGRRDLWAPTQPASVTKK